jgi:integrase
LIVEFTKSFLETGLVVPPGKQREEFCDSVQRGLVIQIAAMFKSDPYYVWRYKTIDTKKTAYRPLGSIKVITISQARKQVAQWKAEHSIAAKLAPEQKPAMGEMTLDTFWTAHAGPHLGGVKKSYPRDVQLFNRIGPRFGSLPLASITRYQVELFKADLMKEKLSPATVDHHIKLLRHLLNLAVQWDMLDKNPLKGFQLLNVDNQIEHYLKEDELQRLLEVLRTHENRPVCLLLMFLLSTGSRSNEARQMLWSQVDLENAVWRIPASNSKSKKTRAVPLNESALWVLEQIGTRDVGGVVFANPEGKAYTPVTHAWYRIRKLAGIPHLRIHDLRHTFASLLVSGGRSLFEVQQILGHSDPKVTMRYAHLSTKALQAAANTASVIVPRATPESATEAKEAGAIPAATPTAEILQFPKAA